MVRCNILLIILSLLSCTLAQGTKEEKLNIGVLVPLEKYDRGCTKKAIKMASDDINSAGFIFSSKLRTSYKFLLSTEEVDNVNREVVETMYKLYYNNVNGPIVSIIGPPYHDLTAYSADYALSLGTYMVSYSEAHEPWPSYLNFYRQVSPSILSRYEAGRILIDLFNWQKIGIIYDYSADMYQKNVDVFRIELERKVVGRNSTIKILATHGFWSNPVDQRVSKELNDLQEKGTRIIFALVSVAGARKIFCEAYHLGMYAPKVIWALFEILPRDWASDKYNADYDKVTKQPKREVNCTEQQLLEASSGYIAITRSGLRKDGVNTIGNMTAKEFKTRLHEGLSAEIKCHENVAYAYDAMWTMAFAHKAHVNSNSFLPYFLIERLHVIFGSRFAASIDKSYIEFEGLTGPLKMNYEKVGNKYHRIGRISIWSNHDNSEPTFVGTYDSATNNLSMILNYENAMFKNGVIPKDKAVYERVYATFSKALLIAMWLIACVGFVVAIAFLFAEFRLLLNHTSVTSYISFLIDCIIVLGSILCYASVIIYGLDTRFVAKENTKYVCWGFLLTLSLGFTLTCGSLFANAWQVYKTYMTSEVKLANNQIILKKTSEWSLLFLPVLVGIDCIILGSWYHESPFGYETRDIAADQDLFKDVIRIEQLIRCSCKHKDEFTTAMYCFKGALLVCGLFLSWQTRTSKFKLHSKPKQNTIAIFNVATLSVIGVICATVLADTTQYEALYAIVAVCICTCTTTTLLLVFIPKIRTLIYSEGLSINDLKHKTNQANHSDLSMRRMDKGMERESTDVKSGDLHQNLDSIDSSIVVGSVISMNPNYLSSSPPSYGIYEEQRRNGDLAGTLNTAFSVDRIDEEPGCHCKNDENEIEKYGTVDYQAREIDL